MHESSFLITGWQLESKFTYFLGDTEEKKGSIPFSEKFQTLIAFCDKWKRNISAVKLFMDSKESIVIHMLMQSGLCWKQSECRKFKQQNLELNCWVLTYWNLILNIYSWTIKWSVLSCSSYRWAPKIRQHIGQNWRHLSWNRQNQKTWMRKWKVLSADKGRAG